MKKVLLGAAFALVAAGTAAKADMVDYAEFQAGYTFGGSYEYNASDYDLDGGLNVGAALGWHVAPQFDIEAEVFYTHRSWSDFPDNTESLSTMVNGIYRIDIGSNIRPYVGAGLGFAQITYYIDGGSQYDDADWTFAYQGFGGLTFDIDPNNISMFVEYRYQGANDATLESSYTRDIEYNSHNVSVGLHFEIN